MGGCLKTSSSTTGGEIATIDAPLRRSREARNFPLSARAYK